MKKLIVPLSLGFGMMLALAIGQRMSTDALAIVVGVAVGVAASVPTSLLLVALLRRERSRMDPYTRSSVTTQPPPQLPPIMMIDANALAHQYGYDLSRRPEPPPTILADGGQPHLRVVGNEEWS